MEKKKIIREIGGFIVKFNHDFWHNVGTYVAENYDECTVEVSSEEGEDVLKDMVEAYEVICQRTHCIYSIEVYASNADEKFQMVLKNYRGFRTINSIAVYVECPNAERENSIRHQLIDIIEVYKVRTWALRGAMLPMIFPLTYYFKDFFAEGDKISYPNFTSYLIVAIIYTIASWGVYPLLRDLILGKERIQFWTSPDNIMKYRKRKTIYNIVSAMLFAIAILLWVLI